MCTMEYYAAERKDSYPYATAWIELESIMLSEISQAVKDKYHMISPICNRIINKIYFKKNGKGYTLKEGKAIPCFLK